MRLQRQQLPQLARKIVKELVARGDIEVINQFEVERDVESVLGTYLTQVDHVSQRARELAQERGLAQGEFGRIKRLAAEQAGIGVGEDALDYVLAQVIEMLMQSANVAEVFADDPQLRRRIREFIREDEVAEDKVDAEVRSQLKHVQEGSRVWEIEYERMKAEIKRRRGM